MKDKLLKMQKGFTSIQSGFTLIELLVVIAVLAVLASGVLVLINPIDKINAANDSKVQQDIGGIGRAAETYAISHGGYYPAALGDLQTSGELKVVPTAPSGYAYTYTALPAACTAGTTCISFTITSLLKSTKYANQYQKYDSLTNKQCQVASTATPC